jgi:Domain of Unknown Function (DUF1259)
LSLNGGAAGLAGGHPDGEDCAAAGVVGGSDGGVVSIGEGGDDGQAEAAACQDTIVDDGHLVPPTFGVTTTVNFQPLGEGKAAINGDIVCRAACRYGSMALPMSLLGAWLKVPDAGGCASGG